MPTLTLGQLKAELARKPSARSAPFKALLQQLRALARLSPDDFADQISSGALRLPRVTLPAGDPDRFSSDWDRVQPASPEPPDARSIPAGLTRPSALQEFRSLPSHRSRDRPCGDVLE